MDWARVRSSSVYMRVSHSSRPTAVLLRFFLQRFRSHGIVSCQAEDCRQWRPGFPEFAQFFVSSSTFLESSLCFSIHWSYWPVSRACQRVSNFPHRHTCGVSCFTLSHSHNLVMVFKGSLFLCKLFRVSGVDQVQQGVHFTLAGGPALRPVWPFPFRRRRAGYFFCSASPPWWLRRWFSFQCRLCCRD